MSNSASLAESLENSIGCLSYLIYCENKKKGFWPEGHKVGEETCLQPIKVFDPKTGTEYDALAALPPRNVGEQIGLIITELAEALETHRKRGFTGESNVLPGTAHFAEELADTIIRILDMDGGFELGVWPALVKKLAYNLSRPVKHGKGY